MALLAINNRSYRHFNILFWLTQLIGILICATTVHWIYEYRQGLGFRTGNRAQQVNLHIVFAVIGMVYFCALEIVSFRALRWISIGWLKIIHALIGLIVIVSTILCLGAIYDEKNYNRNGTNFHSLHSWMGLMVSVLFLLQWVFSFIAYLYPKLSVSIRIGFLPFHVFFGLAIFVLLIADVELGYQETMYRTKMTDSPTFRCKTLLWSTQIIGLVTVALTIGWVFYFKGGVGWRTEPKLEFNWHVISFTVGMFYLYANGILVYRAFPLVPRRKLRLIHTAINGVVIVCMFFGMLTILDSHNFRTPKKENWYSLHDWTGIMAMAVFVFQWIFSVYVYLFPSSSSTLRMSYKPLHIFLGLAAFVCAVATSITGFFGKQKKVPNFTQMPPEGLLLNIITVLHVIFAGLVVYIIFDGNNTNLSKENLSKRNGFGNTSNDSIPSKSEED